MVMKRSQKLKNNTTATLKKINTKTIKRILNTHWLLLCVLLIASTAFASKRLRTPAGSSPGQSNLLLITIDTLRADRVSCYDSRHLKTPHIDALATEGALFTRAFANTSTTLPSHTNILLGVSPLYHGVHENSFFVVHKDFLTLAEHLKAAGYVTGAFVGAFPLDKKFGLDQGFDVYDDDFGHRSSSNRQELERRAEDVLAKAFQWIKTQTSPWFLWVHCYDPHDPYTPPAPFSEQYAQSPYDGEVAYVDAELGKFMLGLREGQRLEDTFVVFTGDHGESLGQHGEMTHGFFAYNTGIWIPMIISGPEIKARRVEQPVSHLDIFPTVCDLLSLEKPKFLQGQSLMSALRGRKFPDRTIYFESLSPYYSMGWAPLQGFIRGGVKFIESPLPELYDLNKDFDEQKNLAPGQDLKAFQKQLSEIIERNTSSLADQSRSRPDRESLEKLRSLGYISSSDTAEAKKSYGPPDDIKTLLPFYNQATEAMTLHQNGKTQEAIEILKTIISEREDFDIPYAHLATLYLEGQGKMDEALEVLKMGFTHNPSSYEIFYKYVNFLIKAGANEKAIELATSARLRQMDYDPEIWTNIGAAYQNTGDFDMAQRAYEQALRIDQRYPIAYNNLGLMYLSLALRHKDARSLQECLENFKKAIAIDPSYADAYAGLGNAYLQTNNLEGGIYCLEKSLDIQPDQGPVIYNLGMAYLNKGDKEKALAYFTRFKKEYSHLLPPTELKNLDDLIKKCSSDQ
jgi:arylsulfatase A-like enzyme/Flp pilus assembly protein TadD